MQQCTELTQISRSTSLILHLSAPASYCSLSALYLQGHYSQTYLVLPSDAKHCFHFTKQFLHFLALEQILLRTAISAGLENGWVGRHSRSLSAALPDSSQGCCCYHRSLYASKAQLPATPTRNILPPRNCIILLVMARAGAEHQDTSALRWSSKCLSTIGTVCVWRSA